MTRNILRKFKSFIKKFDSPISLVIVLYLLNFFVALPMLMKPMNSELDAYGRAKIFKFTESGVFNMTGSVWLPLHESFVSLTQFLPLHPAMNPRAATLAISCLIPGLLFLLTKTLTKHTVISFVTACLFIGFPLFQGVQSTTLSEPLFLFLFITALYAFIQQQWLRFEIFFVLSQMTRFEAWFVIPWVGLLLATLKKLSWRTKVVVFGMCLVFPICYSYLGSRYSQSPVSYYNEMSDMAQKVEIPGVANFPLAVESWNHYVRELYPFSFLGLFLIGQYHYFTTNRRQQNHAQDFVFAILPIFLFVMLVAQVFWHLRDWFPPRYILIPAATTFPMIGLGLLTLWKRFIWQKHWQWLVLALLVFGFELSSVNLQAQRILPTYSQIAFDELLNITTNIKTAVLVNPSTTIWIYNSPTISGELPVMTREFFKYFLLPQIARIDYITDLNLLNDPSFTSGAPYMVIVSNLASASETARLSPIVRLENYTLYASLSAELR